MTFKKLVNDKDFIKMTLNVAVPIMIQNGITNFVGLLDNVMVGRIGTEQMSGISIVNQLLFVFNLAIFGALAGAGIFGAQFYGFGDTKGVRDTFRFKIYIGVILSALGIIILAFGGRNLISLYLNGDNVEALNQTLGYGMDYLKVMLFGLFPFAATQVYSSTLRECGETKVPMRAGIVAVMVNLVFNYLLIFGKLGFPVLGVVGAAIATVISRFVELIIVIFWTHKNTDKMPFAQGVYNSLKVPASLMSKITVKGMPLLLNELLWSGGIAMLNQCYSLRGLDVVAALNISSTISNLFNVVMISMGSCVGIIIGQLLGAGKIEEAKETDDKLIYFSIIACGLVGLVMLALSKVFPMLYNTSAEVKLIATRVLIVSGIYMPFGAYLNAAYFTIRSGGKTFITFLFDSVFMWVCSIPVAFVLSRYSLIYIVWLYAIIQALDLIKCFIGYILIKKGVWINNLIE